LLLSLIFNFILTYCVWGKNYKKIDSENSTQYERNIVDTEIYDESKNDEVNYELNNIITYDQLFYGKWVITECIP